MSGGAASQRRTGGHLKACRLRGIREPAILVGRSLVRVGYECRGKFEERDPERRADDRVRFGVLVLLKALVLVEYNIGFAGLSLALVGALVVAKVVLILENIPLAKWLCGRSGLTHVLRFSWCS